ncbi:HAMP domain-containing sensor histidine kinase [Eubacteriaceae bacterium ES2]|nr:HAMP domain-containing sensor histidine kinase [Eubacteriaceae bacterium ES2]
MNFKKFGFSTMRTRIFISNTMMVLLSLLILFGIGGFSVSLFKDEFLNAIEQNAQLSENIFDVQNILIEMQDNPVSFEELSQQLGQLNFELYVSDANLQSRYSNVKHSEWECIEELEKTELASNKVILYSMENVSIARCRVIVDNQTYNVYATYYPGDFSFWGMDRGMFEMFLIVFSVTGILAIAALMICSQIFTKLLIDRIMKPVRELNRAARRIKEGNFDEAILYEEEDEFGEVCQTFNSMQKNLKAELEKSEAYEKSRTEMISGISHDLRTPLTSIKASIKGILDGVASTPDKQQQYLTIAYRKANDMEGLLKKLFFISKLETGNMPFFRKHVDLGDWLEKYADEKRHENDQLTIDLEKDDGSYNVMIDSEQMKRVFDNLLENSIKYAGVEALKITLSLKQQADKIKIRFSDNGLGLEETKIPHVFEQFYRGDESRNTKNEGSGLGLYVCKYIVEQHGGVIMAENNDGFTVCIELPENSQKGER